MSPDFRTERRLTSTRLGSSLGFSKDGREVISVCQDPIDDAAPWQLWAIDTASGRERRLAVVDVPLGTELVIGFSLHPDGTRFLSSGVSNKSDIWMLTGFDRR